VPRLSNHEIFKETQMANIEGKGRMSGMMSGRLKKF
jgi:hypothetical protein